MTTLNMEILNNINLFLKFFNGIKDMIYLMKVEKEGNYQYMFANEPAIKLLGVADGIIGKSLDDVLSREDSKFIKSKYSEAIERNGAIIYENKVPAHSELMNSELFRKNQSSICYYESTITPVFDDSGICTHILAVVRDVTERRLREREIKQVKQRLELVWNSAADAVFTVDKDSHFVEVNKAFTNLLGWTIDELLEDKSISIIPANYRDDINVVLENIKKGEVIPYNKVQRLTKKGTVIDVLASYSPIYNADGEWVGAVGMYKDISQQVEYYNQLQQSEERYRIIAEHSSDLIKVIDVKGNVQYASPSHFTVLGMEPDYYINKSILTFIHQNDMYEAQSLIEKIIQSGQSNAVEIRAMKKSGEWVWIDTAGSPVLSENGEVIGIIIQGRDITERKQYEEKLKKLALYDHLTSIPNRMYFQTLVRKAMSHAQRSNKLLSVMFFDLDKFKQVNDTMGHDVGDQLLVEFVKRVQTCLREEDVIARFGGDEFAILLPDIDREKCATDIAKNILVKLQHEWEIESYKFTTTSSIGIAFFSSYDLSYDELMKNSDIALYQAKEQGRNIFKVYP